MCISAPGRVVGVDASDAIVDVDGRRRRASLRMQAGVEVGDWVLVGAGSVLRHLDPDEAAELGRALRAAMASASSAPGDRTTGGSR